MKRPHTVHIDLQLTDTELRAYNELIDFHEVSPGALLRNAIRTIYCIHIGHASLVWEKLGLKKAGDNIE